MPSISFPSFLYPVKPLQIQSARVSLFQSAHKSSRPGAMSGGRVEAGKQIADIAQNPSENFFNGPSQGYRVEELGDTECCFQRDCKKGRQVRMLFRADGLHRAGLGAFPASCAFFLIYYCDTLVV